MFAQLDTKTDYSFNEGILSVEQAVAKARELNYTSLAINNYCTAHFAELKKFAKIYSIKPIFSLRVRIDGILYLVYAKDNRGYMDMIRLSSYIEISKNELTEEEFFLYLKNTILIVDSKEFLFDENVNAVDVVKKISEFKVETYLGLTTNSKESNLKNKLLRDISSHYGVKTVALPSVVMFEEDKSFYNLFDAVNNKKLYTENNEDLDVSKFFRSIHSLEILYPGDEIKNADYIAESCNVIVDSLPKGQLPKFSEGNSINSVVEINNLAKEGLFRKVGKDLPQVYKDRVNYELTIINSMGFSDYFLIVLDLINEAKRKGIMVGPGRGSVCGSLTAYALGITEIDPVKHELLFERFLNPDRITMPDIDVDFQSSRRDEIIDYAKKKYGADNVARISAFDTHGKVGSLNVVGNAFGLDPKLLDEMKSFTRYAENLKEAYLNTGLKKIVDNDPKSRYVYSGAYKLSGIRKNLTAHDTGVLINNEPVKNIVSLRPSNIEGILMTQMDSDLLEDEGLIKFDLLPLKTLDIMDSISKSTGKKIDFENLPMDDQEVFKIFTEGRTSGIFQCESPGMIRTLKRIQPSNIYELAHAISLYRPGPMKFIDQYVENKNNPDQIEYIHESLIDILKPTFGIIVYQEQVMEISRIAANFSYAKADVLRKAIGDKDHDKLMMFKKEFIEESIKNGFSEVDAEDLFKNIEYFSEYGYNKSHGFAYAVLAYRAAYLKVKYTVNFYSQTLNYSTGKKQKVLLAEMDSELLERPDVNFSNNEYSPFKNVIFEPLTSLVDVNISDSSIISRIKGTRDFREFVGYAFNKGVSKDVLKVLINQDALRSINTDKQALLNQLDEAILYGHASLINGEYSPELV